MTKSKKAVATVAIFRFAMQTILDPLSCGTENVPHVDKGNVGSGIEIAMQSNSHGHVLHSFYYF